MSEESESPLSGPFDWQKHDRVLSLNPEKVVGYNIRPIEHAQVPEVAKVNKPSRPSQSKRIFRATVSGAAAGLVLTTAVYECAASSNEGAAVGVANAAEEKADGPNPPSFQVEPTAICAVKNEFLLEPIEVKRAIDVVSRMEFLDNAMIPLSEVLTSIEYADSLEESKRIATKYLREKGIPVVFYSHGETEDIALGNKLVGEPSRFNSSLWNVDDSVKQNAIANTVLAFASMPKKVFDSLDRTIYYVPENFIHYAGLASIPVEGDNWHYGVALSLSNMTQPSNSILIHELLGHRVHFEVCGTEGYANDEVFSGINIAGDFRIPQSYASEYARDGGIAEDFAETVQGLLAFGVPDVGNIRNDGVLPAKQALAAQRIAFATGLSIEEIISLGCVSAVYGNNEHPLAQIYNIYNNRSQRFGPSEICRVLE